MENQMFCFQCQETAKGTGCNLAGVCGKKAATAGLQDLLIAVVRGLGSIDHLMRQQGVVCSCTCVSDFMVDALFATISCANYDDEAIAAKIDRGLELKAKRTAKCETNGVTLPDWPEIIYTGSRDTYAADAARFGILRTEDPDVRSLRELTTLGLKGMCAYYEHAARLGQTSDDILAFLSKALYEITSPAATVDSLLPVVLETGKWGVDVMALLDKANTTAYGNPEISRVNIGVGKRPGILITGHDLKDLEQLLEQTQGTGVDVYTHGEMLTASSYPAFKKYKNLVGNYGGAWYAQKEEFARFNGPIVATTNCVLIPKETYADRLYTTGTAGIPGAFNIPCVDGKKDFSRVIEQAKKCAPPEQIDDRELTIGFGHSQVLSLADTIVGAVKSGAISRFVVMAGCDGHFGKRTYYTEFAESLPKDAVILTAGCAKYRLNRLDLGDIGGIPRLIDAGQCNDCYSLVVIALKLAEVFGTDVNGLPLSFNISWYEQKAVLVLLTLLSLGVKDIMLGPRLPKFISPGILDVLVKNFGIKGNSTVKEDMVILNIAEQ